MAGRGLTSKVASAMAPAMRGEGFKRVGLKFFRQSPRGDYALVELQPSLRIHTGLLFFVNVAVIPLPAFLWRKALSRAMRPDIERAGPVLPTVTDNGWWDRIRPRKTDRWYIDWTGTLTEFSDGRWEVADEEAARRLGGQPGKAAHEIGAALIGEVAGRGTEFLSREFMNATRVLRDPFERIMIAHTAAVLSSYAGSQAWS